MHTNEIFIENGRFHGGKIAEAIATELRWITWREISWLDDCIVMTPEIQTM